MPPDLLKALSFDFTQESFLTTRMTACSSYSDSSPMVHPMPSSARLMMKRSPALIGVSDLLKKSDTELAVIMEQATSQLTHSPSISISSYVSSIASVERFYESRELPLQIPTHVNSLLEVLPFIPSLPVITQLSDIPFIDDDEALEDWMIVKDVTGQRSINPVPLASKANIDECTLNSSSGISSPIHKVANVDYTPSRKSIRSIIRIASPKLSRQMPKRWSWLRFCSCISRRPMADCG